MSLGFPWFLSKFDMAWLCDELERPCVDAQSETPHFAALPY